MASGLLSPNPLDAEGLLDFTAQQLREPIYPLVGDPRIGTGSYSLPRVRLNEGLPPVPAYRFTSSGQVPVGRSSISSYSPSFVENKTAEFAEQLGGDYRARQLAKQAMGLLEVLPGTGDVATATDAAHAFDQGRNIEGGLLTGLTALGAIPIVGPAIRRGGKAAMRGIINTPDLRLMDRDSAIFAARSEPHLIQDKSGQYIGGPRGVKTTKKLAAMRAKFDAEVEAGLSGGDWYERARNFNLEIAGSSPARQSLAASEQALMSAQAAPDTNLGFALQAHNASEAGRPLEKVRTGQQAATYNKARAAGVNPKLGKKTSVYGQHLDPTQPQATTGTNDIWHARQFGYTNKDGGTFSRALSEQEHRFLDYETMLAVDRANAKNLGGRSDWTGAEIQAAPWVAGKGRGEAKKRNLTVDEGIAEASKTYPDYGPKYTAYSTSEQVPGRSTGLLGDMIDAPYATKEKFTNAAPWGDDIGRDPIYSDMGMYVRKSDEGPGFYINSKGVAESNPVTVGKPMISLITDPKTKIVDVAKTDQAALSAGEAVRGLLDVQEGAAWNKVITTATKGADRSSLDINIGRMATRGELESINKIAEKHGYGMANTENGVALLDFGGRSFSDVGKLLKGDLGKEISKVLPEAQIKRGRLASDYIDQAENLAKGKAGQGLATKHMVSHLNNLKKEAPGFYNKLLDSEGVSAKARANLDRLIKFGGQGQRTDYEELLKIIGKDKLRGLMDRIKKSGYRGLPAVGGVSVSGGLLGTNDDNTPN